MKQLERKIRGKMNACNNIDLLRSQVHKLTTFMILLLILSIPIVVAQQNSLPAQTIQDTAEPAIQYFTIFPQATSTNPVEISYAAYDYGRTRDLSYCSGIKKIEIFDKNTGQIILTKTSEAEDCALEEIFEYAPIKEGEQTLCARAYDYAGKKSEDLCADLNVIKHAPQIESIQFFDEQGMLKFVPKNGALVSARLQFKDSSVIDTSLSEANTEKITGTKDDWRKFYFGEQNTIIIPDIKTTENFECRITTRITDILGNKEEKETSCDLSTDEKAPALLEITTDLQDQDGTYLISKESQTKITAKFDEEGIGFARQKNAYLDLTSISQNERKPADECQKTAEGWQCIWNIVATAPKGAYTITLLDETQDDYGNKIEKEIKKDVDVIEGSIEILDVQYAPKYPTEEDELALIISMPTDVPQPKVIVDASKITKTSQKANADCDKDGNVLRCTAHIKNLRVTDNVEDVLIEVQDLQGNKKQARAQIQVFETEPKTKDYYKFGGATIQPASGIDRKTATITEYPVFANIKWSSQSGEKGLSIAEQNIDCDRKYLATQIEVYGKENTRPTIFFKTTTEVSEVKDNAIKIQCSANLIIKKEKIIYKKPEIETFKLTIPLYDNPLGSISDTIQKKLDETTTEINDFSKKISDWEDINSALGKLVGIGQTIAQMDAVMASVTDAFWIISVIIELIPFGQGSGEKLWKNFCEPYTKYYNTPTKDYLWSPDYVRSFKFFDPLKTAATIYSCQMCRHTSSLVIPFIGAEGDIVASINEEKGVQTKIDPVTLYEWNPKKSIHVAQNCYCPNAIEYNLRKEKQIKCIYKNCIKEHAKKGLPITTCDKTLKEQTCLYIDSAAWKLAGGLALATLMNQMVFGLLQTTPLGIEGTAWGFICSPDRGIWGEKGTKWAYSGGCSPLLNGAFVVACSTWAGIHELAETDFFAGNQFNWNQYDADLEGRDYCAQEN